MKLFFLVIFGLIYCSWSSPLSRKGSFSKPNPGKPEDFPMDDILKDYWTIIRKPRHAESGNEEGDVDMNSALDSEPNEVETGTKTTTGKTVDKPAPTKAYDKPAPTKTDVKPAPDKTVDKPAPDKTVDKPVPGITVDKQDPTNTVDKPAPTKTVDKPDPGNTFDKSDPGKTDDKPVPGITVDKPDPTNTVDKPAPTKTVDKPDPGNTFDKSDPGKTDDKPVPGITVDKPDPTNTVDKPAPTKTVDKPDPGNTFDKSDPGKTDDKPDHDKTDDKPDSDKTDDEPAPTKTDDEPAPTNPVDKPAPNWEYKTLPFNLEYTGYKVDYKIPTANPYYREKSYWKNGFRDSNGDEQSTNKKANNNMYTRKKYDHYWKFPSETYQLKTRTTWRPWTTHRYQVITDPWRRHGYKSRNHRTRSYKDDEQDSNVFPIIILSCLLVFSAFVILFLTRKKICEIVTGRRSSDTVNPRTLAMNVDEARPLMTKYVA